VPSYANYLPQPLARFGSRSGASTRSRLTSSIPSRAVAGFDALHFFSVRADNRPTTVVDRTFDEVDEALLSFFRGRDRGWVSTDRAHDGYPRDRPRGRDELQAGDGVPDRLLAAARCPSPTRPLSSSLGLLLLVVTSRRDQSGGGRESGGVLSSPPQWREICSTYYFPGTEKRFGSDGCSHAAPNSSPREWFLKHSNPVPKGGCIMPETAFANTRNAKPPCGQR